MTVRLPFALSAVAAALFAVLPRFAAIPPAAWRRYWDERRMNEAPR